MAKKVSALKKAHQAPTIKVKIPIKKTPIDSLFSLISKPSPEVKKEEVGLSDEVALIIGEIEKHLSDCDTKIRYTNWYIGITNDATRRKTQHIKSKKLTDLVYFKHWDAESKEQAAIIERYFQDKGMLDKKGTGGANDYSKYVYVFKAKIGFVDAIFHLLGFV